MEILLDDDVTGQKTKYMINEFIKEIKVSPLNDNLAIALDHDDQLPSVDPITWDYMPGDMNKTIMNIILGIGCLEDELLKIISVFRGFQAGILQINDDGKYLTCVDGVLLHGYKNKAHGKVLHILSTIVAITSRTMHGISLNNLKSSQVRLMLSNGYPANSSLDIFYPSTIVTGMNMNLTSTPTDYVAYLRENINVYKTISQMVGSSSTRSVAQAKMVFLCYGVLYGSVQRESMLSMVDTSFTATMPILSRYVSSDLLVEAIEYRTMDRAYFASEMFQHFSPMNAILPNSIKKQDYLGGTLRKLKTVKTVNMAAIDGYVQPERMRQRVNSLESIFSERDN